MSSEVQNTSITLTLTPEEADALLAVLLRVPATESVSAERIEELLFRILRKLPIAERESGAIKRVR